MLRVLLDQFSFFLSKFMIAQEEFLKIRNIPGEIEKRVKALLKK